MGLYRTLLVLQRNIAHAWEVLFCASGLQNYPAATYEHASWVLSRDKDQLVNEET
jgi:hypothetical protein